MIQKRKTSVTVVDRLVPNASCPRRDPVLGFLNAVKAAVHRHHNYQDT
jgi:hypothetical protein